MLFDRRYFARSLRVTIPTTLKETLSSCKFNSTNLRCLSAHVIVVVDDNKMAQAETSEEFEHARKGGFLKDKRICNYRMNILSFVFIVRTSDTV